MCQIPVQLVSKNPDSPRYTRRHGPTLGTVPVACIAVLRHTHRTNGYKTIILQRRKRSPTRHRRVACKGEDDLEISGLRVRCPRLSWPCCRPSFKGLAVDVDDGFKPTYELTDRGRQVVKELRRPQRSIELYLATDEDREGEAISWHLLQHLKPKVPVKRMVFHEITRGAIDHAVENPREIDDGLVDAAETRRILDRLYGYEVSPILWRKVNRGLSAGRVQSPRPTHC